MSSREPADAPTDRSSRTDRASLIEATAAVSARSAEGLAAVRRSVEGAGEVSRRENAWRHRAEAAERRVTGLEDRAGSRAAVDQAVGLVMGVYGLDAEQAAEVLVWVADHADLDLTTIAERLLVVVRATDLGASVAETLTRVLADLGHRATPGP